MFVVGQCRSAGSVGVLSGETVRVLSVAGGLEGLSLEAWYKAVAACVVALTLGDSVGVAAAGAV